MAEKTVKMELLSAYWPREDERVEAGAIIDLPLDAAMTLLEAGKAKRADPMG